MAYFMQFWTPESNFRTIMGEITNHMKKSILLLITVFLTLVFIGMKHSANAQQELREWSLEDCINYAFDNNIDIKKQLLAVELGKSDLLQSKLTMLPDLNLGGNHIYNWGQTIDRYTNTFAKSRVQSNNFYLSSNMTLFSGLRKINTMKQSELELTATQYDLDYMMDDISVAVAGYYLDILFNQELNGVAQEQLGVTRQQVGRMEKMVEAGTLAKGDLLNIEAQAATEELQVVETNNLIQISYLSLMQLIDYPVTEDFRIEVPELRAIEAPSLAISSDDIYRTASESRPEVKSAEIRLESAEKQVSLAKSYLSPVLSLSGTWATGYSGAQLQGFDPYTEVIPIGYTESGEGVYTNVENYGTTSPIPWATQIKDNNNRSVGFTLQVPIFNGWQVRTAINQAKISMEEANYNLEQTKLELNKTCCRANLQCFRI